MAAKPKKAGEKASPFKTKKTKTPAPKPDNILAPPQKVAEAIDAFREAADQAKYFEGEATVHKSVVLDYAQQQFAKRLQTGDASGFKLQGVETIAMYIVQDSSAGLSDEDLAEFTERWGEEAAEELITRDFASIRFNDKVLEANYDAVVEALQTLPEDVVENLFRPMAMKAQTGAIQTARRYAKSPEDLLEMMRMLKIKNYIK